MITTEEKPKPQQASQPQQGRKKVLVAVPNHPPWIHKMVVFCLLKILNDRRYDVNIILPSWVPCEYNRSRIHEEAVRKGFDFVLMIDADNPPLRNPLDLVELDLDVVGCVTPIWSNKTGDNGAPFYFNAMDWIEEKKAWNEHKESEGLQEVDAIGAGCILIARRVLISLANKSAWMRIWDDRGYAQEGTDWAFCKRAKKEGYKIWAHYDYPCEHYISLGLMEMLGTHQRTNDALKKPQGTAMKELDDRVRQCEEMLKKYDPEGESSEKT